MKKVQHTTTYRQGAVSIYIVIFTTLLISVITVGFIRIMMGERFSTTNSDLAQSAYDSALAGVEDAKVALLKKQECAATGASEGECGHIAEAFDPSSDDNKCDMVNKALHNDTGPVFIATTNNSDDKARALDQWYTCLFVQVNTNNFLGNLQEGKSKLIPLKFVSSVTHIKVSWFKGEDYENDGMPFGNFTYTAAPANVSLLPQHDNWNKNGDIDVTRPSLLRAQLVQTGDSFKLDDFNSYGTNKADRATLFLLPFMSGLPSDSNIISRSTVANTSNPAIDNSPMPVRCDDVAISGGYSCSVTIELPDPISGTRNQNTSFLRLSSYYRSARFEVQGCSSSDCATVVNFDGVQPEIDSTGRANDVFSRVLTRVEFIDDSFPYPEYAVEMSGDGSSAFCKDFIVTDVSADSSNSNCNY